MSIICGTDLSAGEASTGALEVALALGKRRGDREVVLVHVFDPDRGTGDAVLEQARRELDAQAQAQAQDGIAIRTELIVGPPDETLVNFADTENSELIVIAAHSRSTALIRLGTTTAQIIARSAVPVIVVRDPAPWLAFAKGDRPLRVLLGIDDSAVCDLGIQWLQRMRMIGPTEVVLGAIYYPDDAAEHYGLHMHGMVDRDPEIERLMTRDMLRRFHGSSSSREHVTARAQRGLGRIGDHMVELARDEKVDVIVVGTGQKTGLGRLGSVSSIIVNDAPQSVVCVPPQAQVSTISVPVLRAALVATDLSQFSNRAVPYAFSVIEPEDSEVHLIHIVKEDAEVDVPEVTRALYALAPAGAKQRLTAHIVRGDDAAKTVAQTAARLGVDVICIASHGRSGITRALTGSTADRLLRTTRLPVLVLRPS